MILGSDAFIHSCYEAEYLCLQSEPLIACGTGDGTVYLIQASNGQVIRSVQVMEGEVGVVEFAPEVTRREIGDVQLAVAAESVVKILDCSSFAVRQVLEDPSSSEAFAINLLRWTPAWPPTLVTAFYWGDLVVVSTCLLLDGIDINCPSEHGILGTAS
eukprot:Protomagalhaensia_wolfi_Nauph_80__5333@NODE_578_length_2265_cov_14_095687_g433_i0_p1_GENE_NODE_578_length_2265_cov_14_095687_g433_i0NODE_578_length_2265_cov_14_095687_g433_i0_p1_ORF_typecomplete_len158_score11_70ANAPC4_WD40/PF12894_7/0_00083PQQ_2/PF13360_6/0_05WD40_like/PF17005_5/0_049Glucokinase/PF02685_16/0_092_NODE_578_length_2265_cov_14_095687_g433_i06061079